VAEYEGLPFHRKYRPNTLKGYIGNTKLKETAMKSLSSGKLPQVIMLYGSSGCGKTTFARLLAKEYSCLDRDDTMGACGKCENCIAIDEYIATGDVGYMNNIHEVDITDQSGKHDLDNVLEDMLVPGYGNEWKIYIFDECHMATNALQNRLLKIAEEPPEKVLMILCTTNPEKLIETLKNRCQLQLKVAKPTVKELASLLAKVCTQEGVEYDTKGLTFLANRGELTIRTALTNLQQVVTEQGAATYKAVTQVFDEISSTLIIGVFTALKKHDVYRYVYLLYDIKSRMDLVDFYRELCNFVMRGIYVVNSIQLEGISDAEMKVYRDLFNSLGVEQVAYLLERLVKLDTRNLEIELLNLGYQGLDVKQFNFSDTVEIQAPVNELAGEDAMAHTVLGEKSAKMMETGVENAAKGMDVVTLDDLLGMDAVPIDM